MRIVPIDGQRLIHFNILAGFHAAAAQNALVGIIAVEWIGAVDLIRLGLKWDLLVLDGHQLGGVVYRAVSVVVVAHGAIQQVVAEDAVEGLFARRMRFW